MAISKDYLNTVPYSQTMEGKNPLFHPFISLFDQKPKTILPHYHSELEIIVPYNVEGETFCSGQRYSLNHGKAHILGPDCVHAFRIRSPGQGRVYVLKFNAYECESLLSRLTGLNSNDFQQRLKNMKVCFNGNSKRLTGHIDGLMNLYKLGDGTVSVGAEALSLLFDIIKTLFDEQSEQKGDRGNERIRRILDVLEGVRDTSATLDDIAKQCALSKYHLCRLFKQATGMTMGRHLTEMRINRAADLLAAGNANVTEVCYQCGFQDLSYFIQVFKKSLGKTPKRWALSSVQ